MVGIRDDESTTSPKGTFRKRIRGDATLINEIFAGLASYLHR